MERVVLQGDFGRLSFLESKKLNKYGLYVKVLHAYAASQQPYAEVLHPVRDIFTAVRRGFTPVRDMFTAVRRGFTPVRDMFTAVRRGLHAYAASQRLYAEVSRLYAARSQPAHRRKNMTRDHRGRAL